MEDMLDEITEHAPDGKKIEERNWGWETNGAGYLSKQGCAMVKGA